MAPLNTTIKTNPAPEGYPASKGYGNYITSASSGITGVDRESVNGGLFHFKTGSINQRKQWIDRSDYTT